MAGTTTGGKKAAQTNKIKHGDNFYSVIGSIGGKKGTTGGVYGDSERAAAIGKKGGTRSKRGKTYLREANGFRYYMDHQTKKVESYEIQA